MFKDSSVLLLALALCTSFLQTNLLTGAASSNDKINPDAQEITCEKVPRRYMRSLRALTPKKLNDRLKDLLVHVRDHAAWLKCRDQIIACIYLGAEPNTKNLLYQAVLHDDFYMTKFLLEHNANPNEHNNTREDPVLPLCKSHCMAKLLLDNGADVNSISLIRGSLLHQAMWGTLCDKDGRLTQFLIEQGADVNIRCFFSGTTPLIDAVVCCHDEAISEIGPIKKKIFWLLQAGADTRRKIDHEGCKMTAADIAQYNAIKNDCSGCMSLAELIAAYPGRTLQERIICSIILNAYSSDLHLQQAARSHIAIIRRSPYFEANSILLDRFIAEHPEKS